MELARRLCEHVDLLVARQLLRVARVDLAVAEHALVQRMQVRRLGRHRRAPRVGARVLAQQPHAVVADEATLGVEQHELRDARHLEALGQRRDDRRAERERAPRHGRAVLVEVELVAVHARQHDLERLPLRADRRVGTDQLRREAAARWAPARREVDADHADALGHGGRGGGRLARVRRAEQHGRVAAEQRAQARAVELRLFVAQQQRRRRRCAARAGHERDGGAQRAEPVAHAAHRLGWEGGVGLGEARRLVCAGDGARWREQQASRGSVRRQYRGFLHTVEGSSVGSGVHASWRAARLRIVRSASPSEPTNGRSCSAKSSICSRSSSEQCLAAAASSPCTRVSR